MKHYLSINDLPAVGTRAVLARAREIKAMRGEVGDSPLRGQTWALIFSKSSTRTRVSFEVGLGELGARTIFLSGDATQMGRGEPIRDMARVLGRMVDGAVIRTFAHSDVAEFAQASGIPTINALTDDEHPCQILADIMTIEESLGPVAGKKVAFIGDGACNVATSWIHAARLLGFHLAVAAPPGFQPAPALVHGGNVTVTASPEEAATGAEVLYTDVWVSMGKESEKEARLKTFAGFQINEALVARARPGRLVMHCLPAYRGMEITDTVFEANAATIFAQAENRLHAQKALVLLLNEHR